MSARTANIAGMTNRLPATMTLFLRSLFQAKRFGAFTRPGGSSPGITLLLVILVLTALLSISLGIFNLVFTEIKLSGELTDSFSALYASDRGVEKLLYLDLVADAVCEPFDEATGSYPPCPPYKKPGMPEGRMPDILLEEPIKFSNGACMKLYFSRTGNTVVASAEGQYSCANTELSVKRVLYSIYTKSTSRGLPSPIAFWDFNDDTDGSGIAQTIKDSSLGEGVANDGTRGTDSDPLGQSADPEWVYLKQFLGVRDSALLFRDLGPLSGSEYVRVQTTSSLDGFPSGGKPMTISAWIRPNPGLTGGRIVQKGFGVAQAYAYRFSLSDPTALRFEVPYGIVADNKLMCVTSSGIISPVWQHVAVTWDGTKQTSGVKIYVNGAGPQACGVGSQNGGVPSALDDTGTEVWIGNVDWSTALAPLNKRPFGGCIDSVKIYGKELQPQDIAVEYNERKGLYTGVGC